MEEIIGNENIDNNKNLSEPGQFESENGAEVFGGYPPAYRFSKQIEFIRHKRKRLVVKKGLENQLLPLSSIAYLYTSNKIVYAVDQAGKKYIVEGNLSILEQELDETMFFRANRQYIINVNYVKSFRSFERVKLKIDMNVPEINDCHIIVSQETAPTFREWIYAV